MKRKIIPYQPYLKALAKNLRNDSTFGEIILWQHLNRKQMFGFDFHRQKPLLNYIVDFYCYELELVIEVDGLYHNDGEAFDKDKIKEEALKKYSLTTIRFTEQEIKKDIVNVIRVIENYILEKHPELGKI